MSSISLNKVISLATPPQRGRKSVDTTPLRESVLSAADIRTIMDETAKNIFKYDPDLKTYEIKLTPGVITLDPLSENRLHKACYRAHKIFAKQWEAVHHSPALTLSTYATLAMIVSLAPDTGAIEALLTGGAAGAISAQALNAFLASMLYAEFIDTKHYFNTSLNLFNEKINSTQKSNGDPFQIAIELGVEGLPNKIETLLKSYPAVNNIFNNPTSGAYWDRKKNQIIFGYQLMPNEFHALDAFFQQLLTQFDKRNPADKQSLEIKFWGPIFDLQFAMRQRQGLPQAGMINRNDADSWFIEIPSDMKLPKNLQGFSLHIHPTSHKVFAQLSHYLSAKDFENILAAIGSDKHDLINQFKISYRITHQNTVAPYNKAYVYNPDLKPDTQMSAVGSSTANTARPDGPTKNELYASVLGGNSSPVALKSLQNIDALNTFYPITMGLVAAEFEIEQRLNVLLNHFENAVSNDMRIELIKQTGPLFNKDARYKDSNYRHLFLLLADPVGRGAADEVVVLESLGELFPKSGVKQEIMRRILNKAEILYKADAHGNNYYKNKLVTLDPADKRKNTIHVSKVFKEALEELKKIHGEKKYMELTDFEIELFSELLYVREQQSHENIDILAPIIKELLLNRKLPFSKKNQLIDLLAGRFLIPHDTLVTLVEKYIANIDAIENTKEARISIHNGFDHMGNVGTSSLTIKEFMGLVAKTKIELMASFGSNGAYKHYVDPGYIPIPTWVEDSGDTGLKTHLEIQNLAALTKKSFTGGVIDLFREAHEQHMRIAYSDNKKNTKDPLDQFAIPQSYHIKTRKPLSRSKIGQAVRKASQKFIVGHDLDEKIITQSIATHAKILEKYKAFFPSVERFTELMERERRNTPELNYFQLQEKVWNQHLGEFMSSLNDLELPDELTVYIKKALIEHNRAQMNTVRGNIYVANRLNTNLQRLNGETIFKDPSRADNAVKQMGQRILNKIRTEYIEQDTRYKKADGVPVFDSDPTTNETIRKRIDNFLAEILLDNVAHHNPNLPNKRQGNVTGDYAFTFIEPLLNPRLEEILNGKPVTPVRYEVKEFLENRKNEDDLGGRFNETFFSNTGAYVILEWAHTIANKFFNEVGEEIAGKKPTILDVDTKTPEKRQEQIAWILRRLTETSAYLDKQAYFMNYLRNHIIDEHGLSREFAFTFVDDLFNRRTINEPNQILSGFGTKPMALQGETR